MAKASKPLMVGECCDLGLTLKPAELEALLTRMCSCRTGRINSNEPRPVRTRCARGLRADWCRLGARAADTGYADSRFG